MKQEIKSVLRKTGRIAGVTCIAAGSAAVLTSAMALKAIAEGGKYLANAIKEIVREDETSTANTPVEEADFVVGDAQPEPEETV